MEHIGNHIPSNVIKNQILVSGGGFLKTHQFQNEPPTKRPFFILNKNPSEDDVLIVVHPQTNIKGRKKHRPAEVLVEIQKGECSALNEHSIIDCESCNIWRRSIIESQIEKGEVEPLEQLPLAKLECIRNAISASKTLAPIDKRLVLGEEEA